MRTLTSSPYRGAASSTSWSALFASAPVVAQELEIVVRNVLGNRGDKVARGEELEVVPDLLVHAGEVVEDRSECRSRAPIRRELADPDRNLGRFGGVIPVDPCCGDMQNP